MRYQKFYVGDLVHRVNDGAQGIVTFSQPQWCSFCWEQSGPYHYAIDLIDNQGGKVAWFDHKDLDLVSRHPRLIATPPLKGKTK